MITKMTGLLTRVLDDEIRLEIGPIEYQLLVSEAVRRQIQMRTGEVLTFHIAEYLEGNSGGNRFIPRRIGFNTEAELEFFDLFCTVEKIGVKKALKAMARPVKEIADAISRQDVRWLSTLPGIGATTAEQIVTTLKRKVTRFAVMASPSNGEPLTAEANSETKSGSPAKRKQAGGTLQQEQAPSVVASALVIEELYQALLSLGLNPLESRNKLDALLQSGTSFKTVQEAITLIFSTGK